MNNLSPQQLADAKIVEMRKAAMAMIEEQGIEKGIDKTKREGITNALQIKILSIEQIAHIFGVTTEYVQQIKNEITNK